MPSACFIGLQIGKADPYEAADTKMPQLAPCTKIIDVPARNTPANGDLGDGEGELIERTFIHGPYDLTTYLKLVALFAAKSLIHLMYVLEQAIRWNCLPIPPICLSPIYPVRH